MDITSEIASLFGVPTDTLVNGKVTRTVIFKIAGCEELILRHS
jgi:hypothetical protein